MQKEYIVEKSNQIALNVTAGKVDSYREKGETKCTVRVYDQGKIGVAGALGDADFKKLEEQAVAKLQDGIPYPCRLNAGVKKSIIKDKPIIEYQKIIPSAKRLAKKVSVACPRFLVNGKVKINNLSGSYKNSADTDLKYENNSLSVSFLLKDKDSSNVFDASYGAELRTYGVVTENKIVADVKMLHDAFFSEKISLPDGEYPVIMSPYDILAHIFKDFVAEYYVSNGSLFSGKLGEKIFNENFNVASDRNPSTSRTSFYDDEGEIAPDYRAHIIKNGVFKNVINNKDTATTYNLPLAKTASASYDGVPGIGIGGIYCKSTSPDLKTLLGDQKAIYIAITSGGDITTDGVVGMPVQLAFLVENGKVVARLNDFSASGNVKDILGKDFIGISAKDIYSATTDEVLVAKMKIINN